jgi:hypothetical protein
MEQYELDVANVRTAFQWSLAADHIDLAGRIAEAAWGFSEYSVDFETLAWAGAVYEPARARQLPVAITMLAIVSFQSHLRADLSRGLAQVAEAERLATEWALPLPFEVRSIKADLLTMQDPAAAVVVYDEIAALARSQGASGIAAFATWAGVLTRHYSSSRNVEAEARHAVEVCRAHGQPSSHATSLCVLAFVLVERDPVQARLPLDEASAIAALVRDRFLPLRIQLIRARADIELATSSAGTIAASAVTKVFDELARTGDLASRWQLFAMAAYLLVHRPAADVATVVGIFQARHVENNRRQWREGVNRARAELGHDTFDQFVGRGTRLGDQDAIDFLCGRS